LNSREDRPTTYKDAGVDVDGAARLVKALGRHARRTFSEAVLCDLGSFGGLFRLDERRILVASADGVGTKLEVAVATGRHELIGRDLVAHCVNDVAVHGTNPLFFLDYVAASELAPDVVEAVVRGMADECEASGCALIGGETAQLPGVYRGGAYDVVGFIVGEVAADRLVTGERVAQGDVAVGLASAGLHTNGFSLARRLLLDRAGYRLSDRIEELGCTLADELLKPHLNYLRPIRRALEGVPVHGMAHITGGGLIDNVPRQLPDGLRLVVDEGSWERPPVFDLIQRIGNVAKAEMYRTFNMGIGLVVLTPRDAADRLVSEVASEGFEAWVIGEVCEVPEGTRDRVIIG